MWTSWGGLPEAPQALSGLDWQDQTADLRSRADLVVGMGRSYGDVALSARGEVAACNGLDRVLHFDPDGGLLSCEAGVTLGDILDICLPKGWCLPVVPGTRFVTVAGAIANDVHGKNHHRRGCFGRHVRGLVLRRSDGGRLHCSAGENEDWFALTIAGLGLTGVILEAELQLVPVAGSKMDVETIRFGRLDEFFDLSRRSDDSHEYTVGWIDCSSRDARGHFSRANHSDEPVNSDPPGRLFDVPLTLPVCPLNGFSSRAFNSLYFHRRRSRRRREQDFHVWSFPLDRIGRWNRLYGRRGFRQYQCVVQPDAVAGLLREVRGAGQGSCLTVLKMFGQLESPGLLSFPRPGATLALDFPWRGGPTLELFRRLDDIVADCDGAIYPAKDAHMSGADFRRAYPAWEKLEEYRDPALKSRFWERVTEDAR